MSVSDPDTQRMKANRGYVQGYNAQAVVDEGQIVLAAEITNTPGDFSNLDPLLTVAISELERAGVCGGPARGRARRRGVLERAAHRRGRRRQAIQVLIPPDSAGRDAPRPGWTGGRYAWMRAVLAARPRRAWAC